LVREPGDHFDSVVLFLLLEFLRQNAVGIAGSSHVDAQAGVAALRKPGMDRFVARAGLVALAIGHVFDDGGDWATRCVVGEPQASGEEGTVRQRDEDVFVCCHVCA
jgi:hypothetical protein